MFGGEHARRARRLAPDRFPSSETTVTDLRFGVAGHASATLSTLARYDVRLATPPSSSSRACRSTTKRFLMRTSWGGRLSAQTIHPEISLAKARVFLQLHVRTLKLRNAQAHLRDRELVRLYEEEHIARSAAEAARTRAEFLARASGMFAASLDYEETLSAVANAAVPTTADWCAVDLMDGEKLKDVAIANSSRRMWSLPERFGHAHPGRKTGGAMQVIRTGSPQLYAEIPDSCWSQVHTTPSTFTSCARWGFVAR
jgi:hypothetical protein